MPPTTQGSTVAPVTLVLDNRIRVRFAKDGSLEQVTEATPPESPT